MLAGQNWWRMAFSDYGCDPWWGEDQSQKNTDPNIELRANKNWTRLVAGVMVADWHSGGWGLSLSLAPIFSMLHHPSRLLDFPLLTFPHCSVCSCSCSSSMTGWVELEKEAYVWFYFFCVCVCVCVVRSMCCCSLSASACPDRCAARFWEGSISLQFPPTRNSSLKLRCPPARKFFRILYFLQKASVFHNWNFFDKKREGEGIVQKLLPALVHFLLT